MIAVCALIRQKGRFLLCKRMISQKYGGYWEFPTTWYNFNGEIEDSLKEFVFVRLGLETKEIIPKFKLKTNDLSKTTVIACVVSIKDGEIGISGYETFKWVKIKDLCKYLLIFHSVMLVKEIHFLDKER